MRDARQLRTVAASTAFALALVTIQLAVVRWSPVAWPVRIVLPLTIALAPLALWVYRDHLGAWVILVGLAANFAAIAANGGLMPIEQSTVVQAIGAERASQYEPGAWLAGSKDVVVPPGGGRLTFLGDAIIIRAGGAGAALSPGDVVIGAGLGLLLAEGALRLARRAPTRQPEDLPDENAGLARAA